MCTQLWARVIRPRSTLYHQVEKAINECDLLNEERRGGKRLLSRNPNVPLPEKLPPLPDVEEVEGLFFGVPLNGGPWFDRFIHDFRKFGDPKGVTAAEWAAWVGQPVEVVRRRLDVLFRGKTLAYDKKTKRYAVRIVESPIDPPSAQIGPRTQTRASNSSRGRKSRAEQAKSPDVQPSNQSGGGMSGEGVADGLSMRALRGPLASATPDSRDGHQGRDPSASKLPPPARGS